MGRVAYEEIVYDIRIFRPELECIAALMYLIGKGANQKNLVEKMIQFDFHLDAIEKVKELTELEYQAFATHVETTYLNSDHADFVGQALLDDFHEQCVSCRPESENSM